MRTLFQDIRFAFRQMLKSPGFSLTAILSLALGIGATVSVFSVIYGAIFNAWPYSDFDRVCQINTVKKSGDGEGSPALNGAQIRELRKTRAVEDMVALQDWNLVITGSDIPEDVKAVSMSGNAFPFFGMPAMLGRYILPSDATENAEPQPVAVLSYLFWRRHYNSDPGVIGRQIQLVHKNYTILGVMPPRFTWFDGDVYLPLKLSADPAVLYDMYFKIRPGVSTEAIAAEFYPLFQQFDKERPNYFPPDFRITVRKSGEYYVRDLKGTLYLLFGAVALLLAIGCGNVSILLLARGVARQHEFAVRSAVGASRGRVVRQLLTESLVLAAAGTAFGVFLAYRAVDFIVARLPRYSFPHEADFHVNLPVLIFSAVVAIASGVLFGIYPAFDSTRREISQSIQAGTHKVAGTIRGKRMNTGLIAGQIALTLLLLTAAGAAIQGFTRMMRRPLGYDPNHAMSVGIPVHENTLGKWEERAAYFTQLRDRIAAMPGVVEAGISSNATPPYNGWTYPFEILGKNTTEQQEVRTNFVGPEYFSLLRIPLMQGRLWGQNEIHRAATLAVVNEAFVKRYFPGESVIGRSVRMPRLTSLPPYRINAPGSDSWQQIIGVVGDALDDGLTKPILPAVYLPYSLSMFMGTQVLVRTQGPPLEMLQSIRKEIATINPDQQTSAQVDDLETWITREPEWARAQLVSILFSAFSGIALALAAAGLYSVVSYTVIQRTGEFGIRMALGAQHSDVLRIVLLSSAASVGVGLTLGMALSLGFGRIATRWIENGTREPLAAVVGSLVVVVVAAAACLIPARRAWSVEPITALRRE